MEAGRGARLVAPLAGAVVQPLQQRLRRAHEAALGKIEAGKILRRQQRRERMVDLPRIAEGRVGDRLARQEFVRDHVDALVDGLRIVADIGGELGLERCILRKPRHVGRVLQRQLGDPVAVDAEDAHEIDGLAAELRLLPGRKAHDLRVELELAEPHVLAIERSAGEEGGIDEPAVCRLPARRRRRAAAVGIGQDVVDRVEVERHARRQDLALAVLAEAVGEPEDQPHFAAARLAAQIVKIAAVEPVDDTDQPEARARRLQPAHIHDAAGLGRGELVQRAPAGFDLVAQLADIAGDHVDDRRIGRRLAVERLEIAHPAGTEQAAEIVAAILQSGEHDRLLDEERRRFRRSAQG